MFHESADLLVLHRDAPGRRLDRQPTLFARNDKPFFNRNRNRADAAVSAHWEAAADFDEKHANIAILARRRIEDRAGHDVVPARLEHQGFAHPVVVAQKDLPLFRHRHIRQDRPAAGHDAHGIAAGVGVDAKEAVTGHGILGT